MTARGGSSRQRFARRARSRRWAAVRRILLLLVVFALVAGAGWLVFLSSVLAVERVEVSGVRTVGPGEVARTAAVPVGRPLARVDLDAVRTRVEAVPVVELAEVDRAWPHAVSIRVTERTPVAAVSTGATYRLVDDDGVLFRTVRRPPRRLPVMHVGRRPGTTEEAAAVVAALPSDLVRRVSRVHATTMDSIRLQLRDGRSVVWGSAESSALKAEVLGALIKRKARVYDVSVPGAPTLEVR